MLGGPLHGGAHRVALVQRQIVSHTDLVAVAHHRRTWKREESAVGDLHVRSIAEHGCQTSPDPPLVELHVLLGPELLEDAFPLLIRQASEIQLVVVAEKVRPLPQLRNVTGSKQRLPKRDRIRGGQRVEEVLVDPEVEHHVDPAGAVTLEVLARLLGEHIGLAKQHRITQTPLEKAPHLRQVIEVEIPRTAFGGARFDHEGDGVQAKSCDPLLQPEPHDAAGGGAHPRIVHVQVRLVLVEAVEVVRLGFAIVGPGRLLNTGEDHPFVPILGPLLRPQIPVSMRRFRTAA